MAKPGTFQPGADPRRNAGGRPKALQDVVEAARAHTVAAIDVLARIASDTGQPGAARVSASVALLDRGWGRPVQAMEHSGPNNGPIPVSTIDWSAYPSDKILAVVDAMRDLVEG